MTCWRRASLVGVLSVGAALMLVASAGCSILSRSPSATPTPTKTPVSASAAQETPTHTPVPASPTAERSYDRCPLTGLEMADPSLAMRRPLDIKVDNYPGSRPPSGLDKADVVFEHFAEGAITRFSAIFLCQDHDRVGPVRSARLIDVEHLVNMFDGVLVHYGAANRVLPMIREAGFPDMDGYFGATGFFSVPGRVSPFNKYCDTARVWAGVEAEGWQQPADRPGFVFAEDLEGGAQASEVNVRYAPQNRARWEYDASRKLYLRYAEDKPHIEESSGEQLTAANVVIVQAVHTQTDIDEGYGSFSVRIELKGEGPAKVCHDGMVWDGRWVREGDTDMIRFLDGQGNPIPLTPGSVWIQVVPDMGIVETG